MRLCYRFDKDQIEILKAAYKINERPDMNMMTKLAEFLECDIRKIQKWFSNQRMISRKMDGIMRSDRCWFTVEHKKLLVRSFEVNSYPDASEIARLAAYIGCNIKKIANWFVNNRRKIRRAQRGRKEKQNVSDNLENRISKRNIENDQEITSNKSFEIMDINDEMVSSQVNKAWEPIENKTKARSLCFTMLSELKQPEQVSYQISCPCYSCYIASSRYYAMWISRQSEQLLPSHYSNRQSNPSSSHSANNCYCCQP